MNESSGAGAWIRFISYSRPSLLALLLLGACAPAVELPEGVGSGDDSDVIRVSYFRYSKEAQPDLRRQGRIVPNYFVMLSAAWNQKFGHAVREPFIRAFPNPYLGPQVPDPDMRRLVEELFQIGFDRLPHHHPETIDLQLLRSIPQKNDQLLRNLHRILNVQWGAYQKTCIFKDLCDSTGVIKNREIAQIFVDCELAVLKMGTAHCTQVTREFGPAPR